MTTGARPDRYRAAADDVAKWLGFVAVEDLGGLTWPSQPTVSAEVAPSLGWGALGPMVFYADRTLRTGQATYRRADPRGL